MKPCRSVLWSSAVAAMPVRDRVILASSAGYRSMSVSPQEGLTLMESGEDLSELRRWADDHDVALNIVDAISEWYPHEPPSRPLPPAPTRREVLDVATALRASTLTALALHPTDLPGEALAEHLANLCEEASSGIRIQVEFGPLPPIGSLARAWELIELTGRSDVGIVFDTWHFFQGDPDLQLLSRLPGERIHSVQICDGWPGRFQESLMKDMRRHRLLPGDGGFDLAGAFRVLDDIGGLHNVGPEVLSESLVRMPPAAAVQLTAERLDALIGEL